jgi:hypothetical protein
MIDCDQLTGRMRDICRGHDDAGNPIDLSPAKRDRYLRRWAENPPALRRPKSRGLGDTVARFIRRITRGRVKPCGGCKKRQATLNAMFPYKD